MATKEEIVASLKQVFDPEIPVNIYDLGLIYDIGINDDIVEIKMSLTSAHCPAAQSLPAAVERKLLELPGITGAKVAVVWDPPWDQTRISEEGKAMLGIAPPESHGPTPGQIQIIK